MPFTLSYQEAMKIQRAQMAWYRQRIGRKGIKWIKKMTMKCPAHYHPCQPLDIGIINVLVPRGGDFEYLFHMSKFNQDTDPLNASVHDAIRRELL